MQVRSRLFINFTHFMQMLTQRRAGVVGKGPRVHLPVAGLEGQRKVRPDALPEVDPVCEVFARCQYQPFQSQQSGVQIAAARLVRRARDCSQVLVSSLTWASLSWGSKRWKAMTRR